jgi:hypothetical protein
MEAVALRCASCGEQAFSALFYRGPGQHRCKLCGGCLRLEPRALERRSGVDRRRRRQAGHWPDWRIGVDRREAA